MFEKMYLKFLKKMLEHFQGHFEEINAIFWGNLKKIL